MSKSGDKELRDVELRSLHRLTAGQVHHRSPSLSADGRWLCIEVGEGDDSFWLICDERGRAARVLAGPAEGGASFSPDGSLAYGRRVGATVEIWQLAACDNQPRQLLGGDGRLYRDPAFSPDGRWLCYAADESLGEEGATRLWLRDLARGEQTALSMPAAQGERLGRPAWSPRGDLVYFEGNGGAGTAIFAIEMTSWPTTTTAVLRCVTAPSDRCRRPAPLASDLILAERDLEDGASEIVLLDHMGEGPARLRRLTERDRCAREPTVCHRKGEVQLAIAMLSRPDDGEPSRYDVYAGRLLGLRRWRKRVRAAEPGVTER